MTFDTGPSLVYFPCRILHDGIGLMHELVMVCLNDGPVFEILEVTFLVPSRSPHHVLNAVDVAHFLRILKLSQVVFCLFLDHFFFRADFFIFFYALHRLLVQLLITAFLLF